MGKKQQETTGETNGIKDIADYAPTEENPPQRQLNRRQNAMAYTEIPVSSTNV